MISAKYVNGEVDICIDIEGIHELYKYLTLLENKKDTHYHLMTPSWGGNELSEILHDKEDEIINHIRLQRVDK